MKVPNEKNLCLKKTFSWMFQQCKIELYESKNLITHNEYGTMSWNITYDYSTANLL